MDPASASGRSFDPAPERVFRPAGWDFEPAKARRLAHHPRRAPTGNGAGRVTLIGHLTGSRTDHSGHQGQVRGGRAVNHLEPHHGDPFLRLEQSSGRHQSAERRPAILSVIGSKACTLRTAYAGVNGLRLPSPDRRTCLAVVNSPVWVTSSNTSSAKLMFLRPQGQSLAEKFHKRALIPQRTSVPTPTRVLLSAEKLAPMA